MSGRGLVLMLVASCLTLAGASPSRAQANGPSCVVADPTGTPLNVRAAPNGPILGTLANGNAVRIVGSATLSGKPWAQVASLAGQPLGWVFRSFVSCTAAALPAAAPPAAAVPAAAVPARPLHSEPGPVSARPVAVAPAPVDARPTTPPRPVPEAGPLRKRVALVVGNSRYRHATELTNPANDAADVAATLRGMGFDVVPGLDLDFQGLRAAVREFGQKLPAADVALFFYAGHGVQVGRKNYLIPVDAKLETAGDLDIDALDVEAVLRTMEAEPRVNLVLLDACRDNPFTRSLRRSLGASRSAAVGQGLSEIKSGTDTLIAFATNPDNVALDGDGTRNSPFTTALLAHLRTPGLEIEAMMKRVRGDVVRATKGNQVPWSHSALSRDVFLTAGATP